ncbi:MAG: site-specific integrase [Saccharothrix sp.]|nr:site-specific integrase [Saccharothrix sp.]
MTLPRRLAALAADVDLLSFPTTPAAEVRGLATGFLGERHSRSPSTGQTYTSCLRAWLTWCATERVDPVLATRPQVSRFALHLADTPSTATGRPRSPSARNTVLAACAGFVEYAIDADARPDAGRNPFRTVTRPQTHRRRIRPRPRLTVSDVGRLVLAARADHVLGGLLGKVVVGSLALVGVRPTDLCRLETGDARDDGEGGYELDLTVKRGARMTRWMPAQVAADLYAYLRRERVEPEDDLVEVDPLGRRPLLVHPRHRRRVNRDDVLALVKRAAIRADLTVGRELTAREFRALFLTTARAVGVGLEDRQRAAGHDDPRTTELYDGTEWSRRHDPAIRVAALYEDYPSEELTRPLEWARPAGPRRQGKHECDCTPQWRHLRVWLGGLDERLDEFARVVVTEDYEPGVGELPHPACAVCHAVYLGPYRVASLPGDPDGELLALARTRLTDRALYPAALARRDERRRRDEQS